MFRKWNTDKREAVSEAEGIYDDSIRGFSGSNVMKDGGYSHQWHVAAISGLER